MSKLKSKINRKIQNAGPDQILGFASQISDVKGLISLTLGEPDFNTPEHIKAAAIRAINDNQSHYTDPRGVVELRQAATNFMATKYDLHYDVDQEVLTTAGVSEAIFDTFGAILDSGDEVLVPTPAFSLYFNDVAFFNGKVVSIDTSQDNFILTPEKLSEALQNHPRAKAVIINTPGNPTGVSYTSDELKGLADIIRQYDIFCISDEIYSELNYVHEHASIATYLRDQTIVYNGVSKSHAMTGWRVGMIFAPADIIAAIKQVHEYALCSITDNAQFAAAEAFQNGQSDGLAMRDVYLRRRNLLRDGLTKAHIESAEPQGAFYVFAKVPSQFGLDDVAFSLRLAREAKVGVIPGSVFGDAGKGYFRMSYATSEENLTNAVKRIQAFMEENIA